MSDWLVFLKACKLTGGVAGLPKDVKLRCTSDFLVHTFFVSAEVKVFGEVKRFSGDRLRVEFKKEQHLTVFEAGLLWMVFVEKKKPYDYASYHKCLAGGEFIENIKSVELLDVKEGR